MFCNPNRTQDMKPIINETGTDSEYAHGNGLSAYKLGNCMVISVSTVASEACSSVI